ncbi:uncharacterized protein A1O5_02776 [Cladophialophora psammophila CBS 110553]|uniref:Uncharacterized protein n=1 Tax=Cladophialophora psammophila CBS 110553 TaxID=1182543 RepID=W9XAY1_9EURO|nr:uncharacterized protein A1O5_02776 [Cladophialophora psammophila CBS 110553]EXJ74480.1 hypothetical protein A1O5_02776 [Cladophialophora psammophila CBS 110553]
MANPTPFIVLAMLLFILHQVCAKEVSEVPELCTPLGHPDMDCQHGIVCEKDWPSETGNYGLRSHTIKIEPLRRVLFHPSVVNSTATTTETHQRRWSRPSVVPNPGFGFPEQCCRPTVECYNFMTTLEDYDGLDWNGRLLIKDLETWKKAECCMADFVTPKSWCLFPPARNRWYDFGEGPPACSRFHGNYWINSPFR